MMRRRKREVTRTNYSARAYLARIQPAGRRHAGRPHQCCHGLLLDAIRLKNGGLG